MNEETWSENRLWKYRVFVQTFVRSRSASASPLPPQPSHPSSPFLALTHLHDSKNHNSCILLSVSVWGNLSAACTQVLEPHWLCRRTISWYRCHFSFMSLLRRPFDLFYRPSYGRNSWQNCFMVIKKRNELMFILATICRTEVQKSLSIIARFTGGANLLLEQCECRSFHFPLHLYLWKKARERVLDLNPRDCVIVFYPEGHQRDSRACFYCTAEAVKAPEEVRFSHCKILTAKTPVYRHQHRAQVDLPAPPAWPITYERSHEGGRQLDKSARGLSN